MGEAGDLPAEAGAGDLHILGQMLVAAGELRGFVGHEHGREPGARGLAKMLRDGRAGRRRVEITGDDQHEVVRHVAGPVVGLQVVAGTGGEDVAVADDGLAVGMRAEGGLEQRLRQPLVGVVEAHVDLAQDDFLLLRHFLRGQRGVQHGVGEQVDGDSGVLRRHVDIVDGAVERRVGVDVAAMRLDGRGDLPAGAAFRALEEHVLEVVREAGAQRPALVDAAGLHPHLHGTDGRRGVALEQDGEAVGERVAFDGFAPEVLEQGEIA